MPEERTYLVYTYDELSQKAKDKALDWWARQADHDFDYIIDDAKHDGEKRGFHIDDVRWSGFSSQGDGASWCGHINLVEFLDYHLKEDNPDHHRYVVLREIIRDAWVENSAAVSYSGFMYVHSNTMDVDGFDLSALDAAATDYETSGRNPSEYTLACDSPLQGALVPDLAEGIDYMALIRAFDEWLLKEARAYADEIYGRLENAHDYECSEECFKDLCEANEWRFTEDGEID